MYIYMYTYIYIYIYAYVNSTRSFTAVHICIDTYKHMYVGICVCLSVYVCICMYVVHIFMNVWYMATGKRQARAYAERACVKAEEGARAPPRAMHFSVVSVFLFFLVCIFAAHNQL